MKRKYLPLALNVAGRSCLVIGSGREALEKGERLLDSGASVTFITPEFTKSESDRLVSLGGVVYNRSFQLTDLTDQFLVMLATKDDPALTKSVAELCRTKRILLCAIDQAAYCDVVNMSLFERGPLKIAISTDGISPALARKIRLGLEASLRNVPIEQLMSKLKDLREYLEENVSDPSLRMRKLVDAVQNITFEASLKSLEWENK